MKIPRSGVEAEEATAERPRTLKEGKETERENAPWQHQTRREKKRRRKHVEALRSGGGHVFASHRIGHDRMVCFASSGVVQEWKSGSGREWCTEEEPCFSGVIGLPLSPVRWRGA